MPVRLLTQSVLRWPRPDQVLQEVRTWAEEQRRARASLRRVGVFGSYGRGDAGVGSDLDLLLILKRCEEPIWDRLHCWDTGSLPLACDLLVYSLEEWRTLPQWNPRLAQVLRQQTRWLGEVTERLRADL